jgi:broad specificity phosphatase PhoE
MSIYLIRHAQSEFNAVFDASKPDPMIFDAPLSKLGEQQAAETQSRIHHYDITDVIVSPLTRTLQTAALIFGNTRPFKINATVREQVSNSCDVGRSPQELAKDYPHLDFDHLDDCWWHNGEKDHRGISVEPHAVLMARADAFAMFLKENAVKSTAIVSHGNFIHALTGIQPENCQIIEFDPT